jgi:hypothetical protein
MDGPMPKTVLIVLAAVVALIVIVVLTGMRYLRADDDDFDDDAGAEHGHVRNRGAQPTREQHVRSRARHDEEMPGERRAERVGAARAVRSGAGYAAERGPDRRGAARSGGDRGWRDDSDEIPRSGRDRAPVREQLPVRSGRGGHADISEPIAASARSRSSTSSRGAGRGPEEFDSQPNRVGASARVYERVPPGGRERRDDRDRLIGREETDSAGRRGSRDHRDGRDPRDSRDSRDRREARPAARVREVGDHDERDRRAATPPNARSDARKNGARSGRGELLPSVKPRQSKSKRDSDGDWPTSEWDELSDVDYWAELASDKPFSTAVTSAQESRAKSRESRRDARPGPDRQKREDANTSGEVAVRPASRRERKPDRPILPPMARKLDTAAVDRRAAGTGPTAARPSAGRPVHDDDDPLTSPTFPRIAADDSRSYRRTRAASSDARQSASREPDPLQATRNGGRAQTRSYPRPGAGGSDSEATTGGYSVPAGHQMPAAVAAGYAPPTGGYSSPDNGTAGYYSDPPVSLPTGATGSYPAPVEPHSAPGSSYQASSSYPPAAGAGSDGYPASGGIQAADYLPSVPGSLAGTGSYGGDTAAPGSYPSSAAAGYRTETGSGAYPGYADAGSYSLPAHPSGYDNGHPGQAASYQGYAESGSSSGSHLRPEASYQAGAYPGTAEPSFGASLHEGHGDVSYPAYPAPVPAEHGAAYQAPAPQLPSYQDAPYPAGPYDPAGYPAPVHETGGYAGADPYETDPYRQPGYGGSRY